MRRLVAIAPVLVLVGLALPVTAAAGGPDASVAFTFADPEIVESSGLAVLDGGALVGTVNDSGDTGRVFVVDPTDGQTVGVTSWGKATDVEALASMPDGDVLVGDIGDNDGVRSSVTLLRVPVGRGDRDLDAPDPTTYTLRYPDGGQDAETLLVHPRTGRVLVVTKGLLGGRFMRAPAVLRTDRPNRLEQVGTAIGIATDGSFFPDGQHLVVRSYARAAVYDYPDLDEVGTFDLPEQEQGEGIAVDDDGSVLLSTEGARTDVLRVELPRRIVRAMEPEPATTPSSPGEAPPDVGADDGAEVGATDGADDGGPSRPSAIVSAVVLAGVLAGVAGVAAARRLTRRPGDPPPG